MASNSGRLRIHNSPAPAAPAIMKKNMASFGTFTPDFLRNDVRL
jgi:hypothetical protein